MNIQNLNNKLICNPTSLHDIETLAYLSELKEYKDITIDLIDLNSIERNKLNSSNSGAFIGWALNAQNQGKKITILTIDKCYASQHLNVVTV